MPIRWWRSLVLVYPLLLVFVWTALELWRLPEAWAQDPPPRPIKRAATRGDEFTKPLKELHRLTKAAVDAQAPGGDLTTVMADLKQARRALREADRKVRDQFAATEQHLRQAKLPAEILQRHAEAVRSYDAKHQELDTELTEAENAHERITDHWNFQDRAPDRARLRHHLSKASDLLDKHTPKPKHQPLDPHKLPSRPAEPRWKTPQTNSRILPTYARLGSPWLAAQEELDPAYITRVAANSDALVAQVLPKTSGLPTTPTAADLAPTEDVQITQEIRDLATELGNDPVKIYEYVRNTIDFEPTWGSIKGSVLTLWEKSGNAFDTASLLIALFRAANIPARYVLGTIQVPAAQAQNWVGGVVTPQIAATILASGGVPTSYSATHVTLEHVWVEAYVPYGHYRGVPLGQTGKTWIPLDASFKQYDYITPTNLSKVVPFDRASYLAAPPSQLSPVDAHWIQMRNYLDANDPGKTPDDFRRTRQLRTQTLGLLPASLPVRVLVASAESVDVPSSHRHAVRIEILEPMGSGLTFTASLVSLLGKRLTLSYLPAGSTDAALISDYGAVWNVPPYLLRLRPVVMLDGTVAATGTEIGAGHTQLVSVTLLQPGGISETVQHDLLVGGYYALGFGPKGGMNHLLDARFEQFKNTDAQGFPDPYNDPLLGEFLYMMALRYFNELEENDSELLRMRHYTYGRDTGELLSGYEVQVDVSFGVALRFRPDLYSYKLDVTRASLIAFATDGDESHRVSFVQQRGLTSSFLESHTSELMTSLESVSAVKAIQLATQTGIPVRTLDSGNVAQLLPTLMLVDEVKARVADAVAQGFVVAIPEREVAYFNWIGVGWLAEDPQTGKGAYIISDDLRGNISATQRDGQNPTCDILGNRLGGDIYKAIAYAESRWRQYATKDGKINKKGQPYTSGSAFGIMQVERRTWNPNSNSNLKDRRVPKHPATDETIDWESVLWSWQYNVDLGKAIYDDNVRRPKGSRRSTV